MVELLVIYLTHIEIPSCVAQQQVKSEGTKTSTRATNQQKDKVIVLNKMDKHNSQIWTQKQKRCNMNCSVICVIDTSPGKFSQCESSSMTSTTFTNRPLVSLHVGDLKLFGLTCDGEQDNRAEDPINGYFNCAEIFNLTYYSLYLIVLSSPSTLVSFHQSDLI